VNVLVIDIGGSQVKILATGKSESRKFSSGPHLTPKQMIAGVKKLTGDWNYDVVSIGYPGTLSATDRSRSHTTLDPGGWDLILRRRLIVR
jgi:polyphosphate glucokinase